jgi:nicotinate-nucleotide pyrophosphorylase (carboxylating)
MRIKDWQKIGFIERALSEDIGRGDLFSRAGLSREIEAFILSKEDGVFAGREYIEVFKTLFDIELKWHIEDGESFQANTTLLELKGESQDILSLERTILNIALHATGVATITKHYVEKIEPYGVVLLDTRKTRPNLREFEKYAVRCGGGQNHRMGLDDALMLKDTHLKAVGNLESFIREIRGKIPFTSKIEVECEELDMVEKAFKAGADIVMCDNMSLYEMREVVALRNSGYPHILIEASGNITLESVEDVAKTGIDAISSGSIIHQATWVDISMKVR